MISFTVDMEPVAKGRARAFGYKNKQDKISVRMFTPSTTEQAEFRIKSAAIKAMDGAMPFDCALEVNIVFYMKIPKSWSKKLQAQAATETMWHTFKPDRDNLEKLVFDALNKVAYTDDARIAAGGSKKIYSTNPRIEISIRSLDV